LYKKWFNINFKLFVVFLKWFIISPIIKINKGKCIVFFKKINRGRYCFFFWVDRWNGEAFINPHTQLEVLGLYSGHGIPSNNFDIFTIWVRTCRHCYNITYQIIGKKETIQIKFTTNSCRTKFWVNTTHIVSFVYNFLIHFYVWQY